MNTAVVRATNSFNYLALALALAAGTRYVAAMPGGISWWEFLLTVGMMAFIVAFPFIFFLCVVSEGGGAGMRYFVTVLNMLFGIFAGGAIYYALQGKPLDSLGVFVIGLSPVAFANVAYLIFERE